MKGLSVIIAALILAFGSRCVARRQLGENFGGNGSARRDAAGGKNIDWSWLGQLGEGASAGERYRPEFRQYCRAASRRPRLG